MTIIVEGFEITFTARSLYGIANENNEEDTKAAANMFACLLYKAAETQKRLGYEFDADSLDKDGHRIYDMLAKDGYYDEIERQIVEITRSKKADVCDGECDTCKHRRVVPGTEERIDREPSYYCDKEARYEDGRRS
jgi:hypothetical protein